jgi:hypothetical protein
MRVFNIAGPCRPDRHYMIPPERRLPGRIDLVVRWPYTDAAGKPAVQRAAMELKVWRDRDKKGDPLVQGLAQLDDYLGRLGLDEGVLVIFDARSAAAPIEDRTRFEDARTPSGRKVTLLRA